jgi:hypothetical protein
VVGIQVKLALVARLRVSFAATVPSWLMLLPRLAA